MELVCCAGNQTTLISGCPLKHVAQEQWDQYVELGDVPKARNGGTFKTLGRVPNPTAITVFPRREMGERIKNLE